MKGEFENVETFVLLDWFVADFDSKFTRYQLTGNERIIERAINASSQGKELLAVLKDPVQKLLMKLDLDIDCETIHTEIANGTWTNVTYLSFGVEAKKLVQTYAIDFIRKTLENKMAITLPPLLFKIFYLPPLPIAVTDEGHIMHTQRGFTNIRKKRIEINMYPPRDYEFIFKNIVHEVLHVCFLSESKVGDEKTIEAKVEAHTKIFFDRCKDTWRSERTKIIDDLKNTVEKELSVFRTADSALMDFHTEFAKAKFCIETFKQLFDAIADGKVKATPV